MTVRCPTLPILVSVADDEMLPLSGIQLWNSKSRCGPDDSEATTEMYMWVVRNQLLHLHAWKVSRLRDTGYDGILDSWNLGIPSNVGC
jgi:hypothetical protein